MVIPDNLKQIAFFLMQSRIGVMYQARQSSGRRLIVLNLHRIKSKKDKAAIGLAEDIFDDLLNWLKQRFRLVTFRDLASVGYSTKAPLILSFDDGYRDFLELAVPVLKKHRVSVNQNIIVKCVESGRPPMNVELQDFIRQAPATLLAEFPHFGYVDPERREFECLRVSRAFKNRTIADQQMLFASIRKTIDRFDEFRPTLMMNLEEVRYVSKLHEVGSHSYEHATLEYETNDYLKADLNHAQNYFKDKLGVVPTVFAFPNGSARAEQIAIVRAHGFEHILVVGEKYSSSDSCLHHRFTMHASSRFEARARALGWVQSVSYQDGG